MFIEDFPPQHALNANIYTIKMLTRRPGTPYFSFWFMVSTFTPIMSACVGPLANMISIGAIVDPWRDTPAGGEKVVDSGWVLGLNILSLIVGFGANIFLVLNFTGKMRYTIAQVGSIVLWLLASIILGATLLVSWLVGYFDHYDRSGGYYLGCITSGLYFVCFLLLTGNYVGYLIGEYDATFNLDKSQRGLMIHTVMLGAWLCIGPGLFMHQIVPDTGSYSNSLYYSIILVTTIGLGDVLPKDNKGRGLSLIYAFFGVLELGLTISWLRQFVLSNIGPTLFWHRLERSRNNINQMLEKNNLVLNGRQSFELIRRLRTRCELIQRLRSVGFTLGFYTVFWLMGALVFTYIEDWDYFISVYFAFLCLMTIGFGDVSPSTPLGKAIFVVWSLAAVPMMTMLITSVGDAMFSIASHMDDFLSSVMGLKHLYVVEDAVIHETQWKRAEHDLELLQSELHPEQTRHRSHHTHQHSRQFLGTQGRAESVSRRALHAISSIVSEDHLRRDVEELNGGGRSSSESEREMMLDHIVADDDEHRRVSVRIVDLLLASINSDPDRVHTFEEWASVYYLLGEDPMEDMLFLGDKSPLRFPLKEGNYMMNRVMRDLDRRVQEARDKRDEEEANVEEEGDDENAEDGEDDNEEDGNEDGEEENDDDDENDDGEEEEEEDRDGAGDGDLDGDKHGDEERNNSNNMGEDSEGNVSSFTTSTSATSMANLKPTENASPLAK